jgi:hypothetical protein
MRNIQSGSRFSILLTAAVVLGMSELAPAQIETQSDAASSAQSEGWQFSVSPYLWPASLHGTVGLAGHDAEVRPSTGDVLSHLKFGAMGLIEARHGRILVLSDLFYVREGAEQAVSVAGIPIALNVKVSTSTFTFSPYLAYRVYENDRLSIDALGGVRYWSLGTRIALNPDPLGGSPYSGSETWADGVGGSRVQLKLTSRIGAFAAADAGAGGSNLTWQLLTGVGYRIGKSSTLQIGYRREYADRTGPNGFVYDTTQHGLIIGTTFRFH